MKCDRAIVAALAVTTAGILRAGAAPAIWCRNPARDFGSAPTSSNLTFAFDIGNRGDAPLAIGRIRACCGASAAIDVTEIAPGSGAVLRVNLSLGGSGGRITKSVYVSSNDPACPYLQLSMEGMAVRDCDVQPSSVYFSKIDADAVLTQRVAITCPQDLSVVFTSVECASRFFRVSFDSRATNACELSVRTVPPLDAGVLRAEAVVRTSSPLLPTVRIPLVAAVAAEVTVVPDSLVMVANEGGGTLSRLLAVRFAPGASYRVLGANAPPGMTVGVKDIAGGGMVALSGIVPTSDLDGKYIEIRTDNPRAPSVRVPIRVLAPGAAAASRSGRRK